MNKTVFDDTVPLFCENRFSSTQAKQFTVDSSTGIAAANEAVKKIIDSSTQPGEEDTTCSSRHGAYEHDKHDSCEPWILPRTSWSHSFTTYVQCSTTCNCNHHHHRPDRTSTARCSNQCNLPKGPLSLHTILGFTQVALIAASCCIGHICIVSGGGGCSCMLSTCTHGGITLCNWRWWCYIYLYIQLRVFVCLFTVNVKTTAWIDAKCSGITDNDPRKVSSEDWNHPS